MFVACEVVVDGTPGLYETIHRRRDVRSQFTGQPADEASESARSRIRSVGDEVVAYMLFRDEARLTDRIAGTS